MYSCFVSFIFVCEGGCDALFKRLGWKYSSEVQNTNWKMDLLKIFEFFGFQMICNLPKKGNSNKI